MSHKHPESVFWGMNFRRRKSADLTRNEFLKRIPFFEHLSEKQLKTLAQYLHERRYEEGEYLFEINHPAAALFFIMSGEVSVETSSDPAHAIHLATIKPAEFLGEMALVDHSPRSASARVVKPTVALALSRSDLQRLSKASPEIACEVFRSLASIIGERLKATNRQVGTARKAA